MADNFTATPGTGVSFRTKEISSIQHPVYLQEATTDGGCSTYRNINLGTTGVSVKASAGQIYGGDFFNTDAADVAYVKVYNNAGTPTDASTPIRTYLVPPLGGVAFAKPVGLELGTGISLRATKLLADNDTTAPTSAIVVNLDYI